LKIALEREVTATTSNLLHCQGPLRVAVFCCRTKNVLKKFYCKFIF